MAMDPDRWERVDRVYHAALAQPADRRAASLAEACGGDEELRREVESLLAQNVSADAVLTVGAVAAAAGLVSDAGRSALTGRRIGAYQILAPLGAGGMGEVYRARDTRLGREVAIKILPRAFTTDADRLARFEREARVLASLNHPHIAAIYGIEEASLDVGAGFSGPMRALVLELVEGETLAERLARAGRPLPIKEALDIARQIADALDAAHEKGIVHRDLKPANIKITPQGAVKVLDFGLAKLEASGAGHAGGEFTQAPTVTVNDTREGLIVGTAAYMSPEQARGQTVDKRTDIWAFGCVLYEMLTGRAAFARATMTDTLAAVVEKEPHWAILPASMPVAVRRLLGRCLEKDPRKRLRDIGDAMAELSDKGPESASLPDVRSKRKVVGLSVACAVLAAISIAAWALRPPGGTQVSEKITRTAIVLPPGQGLATGDADYPLAISPDGTKLAYVVQQEGQTLLHVRELSSLDSRAIQGTAGARHPFFSPDGQWIGFFAAGTLQKVLLDGGTPLRICNVAGATTGATWGPDGTIVWGSKGSDLMKVSAAGGVPEVLADSKPADWPEILPDGKTILFTTGTRADGSAIAAIALDGTNKRIVARTTDSPLKGPAVLGAGVGIAQVRFVARGGYLVYGQSQNPGSVRAIQFDPVSLTSKGSTAVLVDSIEKGSNGGGVYFAVSKTGLLAYASTGDHHQLVWVDRNGISTPISADRAAFRLPVLSPDGKRVAVAINDETRRSDIWVYDAERGTKLRLTAERHNLNPVWTPDGREVTFSNGGIATAQADGDRAATVLLSADKARAVLPAGTFPYPTSWSPDGRTLLFQSDVRGVWLLPHDGQAPPRALLMGQSNARFASFSPDGRWIVYVSDESGRDEVYVRRYPEFDKSFVISSEGGDRPRWSRDGREIFYRQGDALMAVSVEAIPAFRAEKPRRLFAGQFTGAGRDLSFDISPDGRRFVMVKSDDASTLRQLTVVQHWFESLARDASTR